jgi:hypothetical protein
VYDTVVDRPETWRGLRDGLDDQRTLRSGRMGVRDLATTLERFAGRQLGLVRAWRCQAQGGHPIGTYAPSVGGSVSGLSLPPRWGRSL